MDPVQEKTPKVPKLNQEQQKQVDLEVKAMLEKGSISKVCHSKVEFLSSLFLISNENDWNRPVINLKDLDRFISYKHLKMEGLHYLKYVLQKRDYMCKIDLKDAYFSVPLHKDSRKLGRFLWAENLYEFLCLCSGLGQIIKGSNLSFETSDNKAHNLSRRFIDFRNQYERNVYGKGPCDSPIATSRLCDKSEVCVRSCTRNIVLRVDCEFPNYDFVIAKEKSDDKRSMPEFIQSIRGITSRFVKTNRNTFLNHSSSAPSPSTVWLLATRANYISKTNTVLPYFGKAKKIPMAKNEL